MILDYLKNAELYFGLNPFIKQGLEYLIDNDLKTTQAGKYAISENFVILSLNEYDTKPVEQGFLEAHRKHIDIQFMVSGEEKIGYDSLGHSLSSVEYHEEKDIQFFGGTGEFLTLKENMFAIFFPIDLHMPGLQINSPARVKKAVIKVRV
jgi:YhcH/YjgK/YiaL family protein